MSARRPSKEIANYDPQAWCENAEGLCEAGITAKFVQNPIILKLLISTGNKCLVECAYDKLWGNGIPLHDENCFDTECWSGENLLGNILMKIRNANRVIIGDNDKAELGT